MLPFELKQFVNCLNVWVMKILLTLLMTDSLCYCLNFNESSTSGNSKTTNAFSICQPKHVHLSYGDVVSDVIIMWSTEDNCSTSVEYDKTPWNLQIKAIGSIFKLEMKNKLGGKYLHRVILKNLDSEKTYFYRPVSNSISSGPFYFKSMPFSQNWSPQFMVCGDLGVHTHSIPFITHEILTGKYTAILHAGDFGYTVKDESGKLGDRFMNMIEGFSSKIPYLTAPGNHEIVEDSFAQYRHRFSMPNTDWPMPLNKMWYSLNIGPVHLISYSTEVYFMSDNSYVQQQRDWLIKDLKTANKKRDKQPWIIAFGHRPMYCDQISGEDCFTLESKVRAGFEDIFYHYGVDIVLQTHIHSYERLWPMYKSVVLSEDYNNPLAPIQLTTGAAGSDHGNKSTPLAPKKAWTAFRMNSDSKNSVGILKVVNGTHVKWEQKFVKDSSIIDAIWIVQENHGPFNRATLPENITEEIEETIKKTGGKPVYLDNTTQIFEKDKKQRLYIGIAFGSLFFVIVIFVVAVRSCRKKHRAGRRWETMDFNYGKKFYSASKTNEKEMDLDNDFEIDVSDGTLPTTKLLADD